MEYPVKRIDFSDYKEKPFSSFLMDHLPDVSVLRLDESSVFRLQSVDRAHFGKEEILLRDAKMQKLVSVSRTDGHGIAAIGHLGRAGNEYLQITGFDRDSNNDIWVLDARGKKVLEYDGRTFDFKNKYAIKESYVDIKYLKTGGWLLYLLPNEKSNEFQLQEYTDQFLPKNTFLPIDGSPDLNSVLSLQSFTPLNETSFSSCDIFGGDYVTVIDRHGNIECQYELDFGKYRIPDKIRPAISSHISELVQYRCACAPLFVSKGKVGGKLFNQTAMSFFLADRQGKVLYIPDTNLEQMTLIHCDEESMSFFINSKIDDPCISALCPDISVADYIMFLHF